jgi:putative ABC transport system permease protein
VELPGFEVAELPDLWVPMRLDRSGPFWNSHVYPAMARLAPGATPSGAEAELERLTARLPESFPNAYNQSFFDRYGFRTRAVPLKQAVLGDMADNLWILFGAVGLVMLIASANVANLFVVRSESRSHELGIRTALGASRPAIARHLLLEGAVLALAGGVLGTLIGAWALPALASLAPAGMPRIHRAGIGLGTVGFMLALAFAVALLLTAWPLVSQSRRGVQASLGGSVRGASAGRERQAFRSALVIAQVALALTLVVGAGLLLRTLQSLRATELGFEPSGVLAADIYLSPQRYPDDAAVWSFYQVALGRIRALPGVAAAGFGEQIPVEGGFGCTVQGFEDEAVYQEIRDAGMTTCAGETAVTPGYLEALGIPILEGRGLEDGDNADPGRAAVVVSRAFAERFWPDREILGQGVAPGGRTIGPFYHTVGVAGDVPKRSTEAAAPLSQTAVAIYYPMMFDPKVPGRWGWWPGVGTLVVKATEADRSDLFGSIRSVVSELDPEVPLANLRSMDQVVGRANARIAFVSVLLAIAAGVALTLAAVGLYGVIAFVVGRRTREIGMRLAIGAEPGQVLRMVVGRSLGLVSAGLVMGVLLALGSARVLRGLLVGVAPTDPLSYALAAGVLAAVALLAAWMPARRAARVDPVEALRVE